VLDDLTVVRMQMILAGDFRFSRAGYSRASSFTPHLACGIVPITAQGISIRMDLHYAHLQHQPRRWTHPPASGLQSSLNSRAQSERSARRMLNPAASGGLAMRTKAERAKIEAQRSIAGANRQLSLPPPPPPIPLLHRALVVIGLS